MAPRRAIPRGLAPPISPIPGMTDFTSCSKSSGFDNRDSVYTVPLSDVNSGITVPHLD
ncbi:hypothetical protein U1Q18_046421, partial [Sarracenia purpurea var. burkii]